MSMFKAVIELTSSTWERHQFLFSAVLKWTCIGVDFRFRFTKFIYVQTNSIILTTLFTRHWLHTNWTYGNLIVVLQMTFLAVVLDVGIMLATAISWIYVNNKHADVGESKELTRRSLYRHHKKWEENLERNDEIFLWLANFFLIYSSISYLVYYKIPFYNACLNEGTPCFDY